MNIVAIIQARIGSTRLPGKVLMDLEGKTVLERVIERVKASKVDNVIVATTISDKDDGIENLCKKIGVKVYRGSEEDVLDRYYNAAKLCNAEHVVRITSDCPLMDYRIIDLVINEYFENKSEYTNMEETFPDGEDVEIFTFFALGKAWKEAKLSSEREHVTPYIRKNPNLFKLYNVKNSEDLKDYRWTLDTKRDYEFIKIVYENLFSIDPFFGMKDILNLLKKKPEIMDINKDIIRNEGYLKSLREDKEIN